MQPRPSGAWAPALRGIGWAAWLALTALVAARGLEGAAAPRGVFVAGATLCVALLLRGDGGRSVLHVGTWVAFGGPLVVWTASAGTPAGTAARAVVTALLTAGLWALRHPRPPS